METDPTEAILPNWHAGIPPAPETFPENADFQLRREESDYLRERIMSSMPTSLLAFLADKGNADDSADFAWLHPQFGQFPAAVRTQLEHARNFSEAIYGAALLYNLMLAEKSAAKESQKEYEEELQQWAAGLLARENEFAQWNRKQFWSVVKTDPAIRISIPTQQFVDDWLDMAQMPTIAGRIKTHEPARLLINGREHSLKGPLARLENRDALRNWNGAAGTGDSIFVGGGLKPSLATSSPARKDQMLEPQDRRQLLDCLRPPEGYSLDFALGTTFTLDLLALLTAPVAFTFFDWENEAGQPTSNPHALLAAIRRNADRIALFCQAGRIAIPSGYKQLFSYLEDSVFQVAPLNPEGVFHPKIWFLRYCAPDQPVRYRFLCLSRNLTFDRSWDTALVLEGDLQDRKRPYARNRPLCDFLAALPKICPTATGARTHRRNDSPLSSRTDQSGFRIA